MIGVAGIGTDMTVIDSDLCYINKLLAVTGAYRAAIATIATPPIVPHPAPLIAPKSRRGACPA